MCDECRSKNRKVQKKQERATYRSPTVHKKTEPERTLAEQNRFMRELGLTYGGKPIERGVYPREPKFLEGVKMKWRKTGSGDCGGESQ